MSLEGLDIQEYYQRLKPHKKNNFHRETWAEQLGHLKKRNVIVYAGKVKASSDSRTY